MDGEKDAKRQKTAKPESATQFVQQREAQIKKLKEQEQKIRRRKLALPTPQVGERELEEIVKIGQAGEAARDLVADGGAGGATNELVGNYEALSAARNARTPRVAAVEDNVLAEARNLRHLVSAQTPLLGDENTPFHGRDDPSAGTGFEGVTPRASAVATPNPLATPRAGMPGATPRAAGPGATPQRTPFRDNLSINEAGPSWGETPREDARRARDARRALKVGFAALPRPENNFELEDPEEEEEEEEEEGEGDVELTEEDAAERDARLAAARAEEERLELERRSDVVKRGLPRPANVDARALIAELTLATADAEESLAAALALVNIEVVALMKHDSLAHPLPGTRSAGDLASDYNMPDDDYVAAAKAAIHAELAGTFGLPGANPEQLGGVIAAQAADDATAFAGAWSSAELVYDPTLGWVDVTSLTDAQRKAAYAGGIARSRDRMVAEATRAAKAEKKLGKQFGGYAAINAKARTGLGAAIEDMHGAARDLATFSMLKTLEDAAVPSRLEAKRFEVDALERRERDLQTRYAELNDERRALVDSIESLETDREVIKAQMALDAQELAEANGV
jgi:pre-mRNA-splicing factor CDC5/CEF1